MKNDVIAEYLSRQVEHIRAGDAAESAITPANYEFRFEGKTEIDGAEAMIFAVRAKRRGPGLFDGQIYLNAATGALLRAEGDFVQSPSMFVSHLHFARDYGEFDGFTLPVHTRSDSNTHIAGHAFMDVYNRDYQVNSDQQAAGTPHLPSPAQTRSPRAADMAGDPARP